MLCWSIIVIALHFPHLVAWKVVTQLISCWPDSLNLRLTDVVMYTFLVFCWSLPCKCQWYCGRQHMKTRGFSSSEARGSSCRWNNFVRFILGPVVKWPRGVRDCDKALQRPDYLCPSLTLLTRALFLSDSSHTRMEKRGELAPAYLPFAPLCCCLNGHKDGHLL